MALLFHLVDQPNEPLPQQFRLIEVRKSLDFGVPLRQVTLDRGVESPPLFRYCARHANIVVQYNIERNKNLLKYSTMRELCAEMASLSRNLGVRLDPELATRLKSFENSTGIEGTTLARKLLDAALDYFEHHGSITFPLSVIPKSAVPAHLSVPATVLFEDAAEYAKKKHRKKA